MKTLEYTRDLFSESGTLLAQERSDAPFADIAVGEMIGEMRVLDVMRCEIETSGSRTLVTYVVVPALD